LTGSCVLLELNKPGVEPQLASLAGMSVVLFAASAWVLKRRMV
jgi:hypothetical protein